MITPIPRFANSRRSYGVPLLAAASREMPAALGYILYLGLAGAITMAAALICCDGVFASERDPHQRALFMKQHPCPATHRTTGACPGYVIDHVKPLCAGGPDHPSNMQWQTVAAAKVKDREERKMCSHAPPSASSVRRDEVPTKAHAAKVG